MSEPTDPLLEWKDRLERALDGIFAAHLRLEARVKALEDVLAADPQLRARVKARELEVHHQNLTAFEDQNPGLAARLDLRTPEELEPPPASSDEE